MITLNRVERIFVLIDQVIYLRQVHREFLHWIKLCRLVVFLDKHKALLDIERCLEEIFEYECL